MKTVKFGLIGCGLMAREFASAAARWCHLTADVPRPEIVGVCSVVPQEIEWFRKNFPQIKYAVSDYKELLEKDDVDAIYCAVPHHLHEKFYIDVIRSGKALLGEKPFGIDKAANDAILKAYRETPGAFVRCCSEFPYYPAMQTLIRWYREGRFGKVLELHAGFNHCSDMDLDKPIGWKRQKQFCGEYGCLGDLGIHTQHVPFRLGFKPETVRAHFSDIGNTRPDGTGGTAACDTFVTYAQRRRRRDPHDAGDKAHVSRLDEPLVLRDLRHGLQRALFLGRRQRVLLHVVMGERAVVEPHHHRLQADDPHDHGTDLRVRLR